MNQPKRVQFLAPVLTNREQTLASNMGLKLLNVYIALKINLLRGLSAPVLTNTPKNPLSTLLLKEDYKNKIFKKVGGDLLSHGCAVPSARLGLTSLFGMGRGDPQRYNHQNIFWTTNLLELNLLNLSFYALYA